MDTSRRRAMMGQSSEEPVIGGRWQDYIASGRTLLLDGIEKGSDDGSVWVSKTGSVSFTNNGATSGYDHYYFDGTDDYMTNTSFSPTASGTGTIEVVCDNERFESTANSLVFAGRVNGGLAFGFNGSKLILISMGSSGRARPIATLAKASWSINSSYRYENGVSMSTSGSDYWGSRDSNNYIGRRSSGNYFKGKIYSIRIYSRKLIIDEVLTNLSVDNVRFNLGLSSYTQVEYIVNSGNVGIDIHIAARNAHSCEIKMTAVSNADSAQYMCSCFQGTDLRYNMLGIGTTNNAFIGYGDTTGAAAISVNDSITNGTPFIAKTVLSDGFQSLSIKQEGDTDFTTATNNISGNISGNYGFVLYTLNNAASFSGYCQSGTKIYYIKLYDDDNFTNLVFYGIPCLYLGQYGLWDLVTNKFVGRYYSTATTALSGGPAI